MFLSVHIVIFLNNNLTMGTYLHVFSVVIIVTLHITWQEHMNKCSRPQGGKGVLCIRIHVTTQLYK